MNNQRYRLLLLQSLASVRQGSCELIAIPGKKLLHKVFLVCQRTRKIPTRANASVGSLGQTLVLRIGLGPYPGQVVKIIVNAFHSIGRNEPLGPHEGPVNRQGENCKGYNVVT